eukprot:TRINITY_DN61029_c0_g1_i1.p1 TRINITY_DN61029_c0_g1~~TRINITY_DN61029_c0_g1_i1.p1  ORF type:complete len:865 (+),score=139.86 TRINITY_DN61029_c0_g1_i1:31-2595(+)
MGGEFSDSSDSSSVEDGQAPRPRSSRLQLCCHRMERRVAGRVIRCSSSQWLMIVRNIAHIGTMLNALLAIYQDLFAKETQFIDSRPLYLGINLKSYEWLQWLKLAFLVVTILLTSEKLLLLICGLRAYGRAFLEGQFLAIVLVSLCVTVLTVLASILSIEFLYVPIPLLCTVRILLNSAFLSHLSKFGIVERSLEDGKLSSAAVIDAINAVVPPEERHLLIKVAQACHAKQTDWAPEDLKSFLQEAHHQLSGDLGSVDSMLISIVDHLAAEGKQVVESQYSQADTFKSGFKHILGNKCSTFALFCLVSLLESFLDPLQAIVISSFTLAAEEQDIGKALRACGAQITLLVLRVLLFSWGCHLSAKCISAGIRSVQLGIGERMVHLAADDRAVYNDGTLTTIFSGNVVRLEKLLNGILRNFCNPAINLVVVLLYTTYKKHEVGLLALTLFPFIFTTVPKLGPSRASHESTAADAMAVKAFQNGVSCRQMVWSYDKQEEWAKGLFSQVLENVENKKYYSELWGGAVLGYVQQLVVLFVAVHTMLLALMASSGRLPVYEFTGFVSLFSSLASPSSKLGGFLRTASTLSGCCQRIDLLLGGTGVATATVDEAQMTPDSSDLKLEGPIVTFPGGVEPLYFPGQTLQIGAGQKVAVIGSRTSGRVEFMQLLTTWLRPSSGQMNRGEVSLGQMDPGRAEVIAHRLRDVTSVVFKEPMLLMASVYDNIALGCSAARDQEVEWAAAAVGLDLSALEAREVDSFTEEEAQLVCLARAILRRPALLILDEATANLEPDAESNFLQAVARLHGTELGSTTVLSSTSTLELLVMHGLADRILQFDNRALQVMSVRAGDVTDTCVFSRL